MKNLVLLALALSACTTEEQHKANDLKRAVVAKMADPTAVKFTNLKIRLRTLCGEVNSKNPKGTYAGPQSFYTSGSKVTLKSEAEANDARFTGLGNSVGGSGELGAVASFNERYGECQNDGKPVT